jgi:hypothetical protein
MTILLWRVLAIEKGGAISMATTNETCSNNNKQSSCDLLNFIFYKVKVRMELEKIKFLAFFKTKVKYSIAAFNKTFCYYYKLSFVIITNHFISFIQRGRTIRIFCPFFSLKIVSINFFLQHFWNYNSYSKALL